jgi:acyl transferase domain-containing protein
VKSNIGHLDTAAGIVGLIKVALALEHGKIPPSLHFEAPNPAIPSTAARSRWPPSSRNGARGQPRRAGVNSLGVGGTNAFAVLESRPTRRPAADDASATAGAVGPQPARPRRGSTRLGGWLKAHPASRWPISPIPCSTAASLRVPPGAGGGFSHEEAAALLETPDARRVFTHRRRSRAALHGVHVPRRRRAVLPHGPRSV